MIRLKRVSSFLEFCEGGGFDGVARTLVARTTKHPNELMKQRNLALPWRLFALAGTALFAIPEHAPETSGPYRAFYDVLVAGKFWHWSASDCGHFSANEYH